jgi:hypothetical protein
MSTATLPEINLAVLNHEIARWEQEVARLAARKRNCAGPAGEANLRYAYLTNARWLRGPAESYALWRPGVLLVGPAIVGVLAFILIDHLVDSFRNALLGFAIGASIGACMFATLLFLPKDSILPTAIAEAEADARITNDQFNAAKQEWTAAKQRLKILGTERRRLIASAEYQRAALSAAARLQREVLLQRNWKAMRSDEWEGYLAEVFRALGAKVEQTGKCGDQGCDLVVEFGEERIAIQAKGYFHVVSNKAVQEAYTSARHWGCTACAVITNSRFTRKAIELAESTDCILIGEDEFPDFVLGKIELCRQRE